MQWINWVQLQLIHRIRNSCNANKFKLKKKKQNRRQIGSDLARPKTSRPTHTKHPIFPLVRRNAAHRRTHRQFNMSEHVVSCDGANVTAVKSLHFAHGLTTTKKMLCMSNDPLILDFLFI